MFEGLLAVLGITDVSRGQSRLARTPIARTGELVEGETVALRGTIAPLGATATSPLGNVPCLAWAAVFEECGKDDDIHELGRSGGGVPFLLRTDSGTARIVPDHLLLLTLGSYSVSILKSFGKHRLRTDQALKDLAARGHVRRPNWEGSSLRVREFLIGADDVVTVCGHVAREPDPEADAQVAGYREALPTRPVLSGTRKQRLLVARVGAS